MAHAGSTPSNAAVRAAFAIALSIAVVGCFDPAYPDGVLCSETGRCPPDQQCGGDGVCRRDARDAAPPDASLSDASADAALGPLVQLCSSTEPGFPPVGCPPPLTCYFAGPGADPTRGFCTRECETPDDCADYTGPGLIDCVFFDVAMETLCGVRCAGEAECPTGLTCVMVGGGGVCDPMSSN